jgi:amidase
MAAAPPIADWRALTASKREAVAAKIPQEWRLSSAILDTISETSTRSVLSVPRESGILSEKELEITEKYDATALVELMSTGQLKSYDVTLAFCKRAAIAQQCVNCLTEVFFEDALARAREVDDFLAKEGKPLGPLHGLPISLKV